MRLLAYIILPMLLLFASSQKVAACPAGELFSFEPLTDQDMDTVKIAFTGHPIEPTNRKGLRVSTVFQITEMEKGIRIWPRKIKVYHRCGWSFRQGNSYQIGAIKTKGNWNGVVAAYPQTAPQHAPAKSSFIKIYWPFLMLVSFMICCAMIYKSISQK